MKFVACKAKVSNRGVPPDSVLTEFIEWGAIAADEIFAPSPNPVDIYADIEPILGPWVNLLHRRAAMIETMRVTAGFESSSKWRQCVDLTNRTSMTHAAGQETGIFQVSFDSTRINNVPMIPFPVAHCSATVVSI